MVWFPSREFVINTAWLALAMIATDLVAWTGLIALTSEANVLAASVSKALRVPASSRPSPSDPRCPQASAEVSSNVPLERAPGPPQLRGVDDVGGSARGARRSGGQEAVRGVAGRMIASCECSGSGGLAWFRL